MCRTSLNREKRLTDVTKKNATQNLHQLHSNAELIRWNKVGFTIQVVTCIVTLLVPQSWSCVVTPQVRKKILEEEIHCPPEASVLLASYAVHAKVSASFAREKSYSHLFSRKMSSTFICEFFNGLCIFKICMTRWKLILLLEHIFLNYCSDEVLKAVDNL